MIEQDQSWTKDKQSDQKDETIFEQPFHDQANVSKATTNNYNALVMI